MKRNIFSTFSGPNPCDAKLVPQKIINPEKCSRSGISGEGVSFLIIAVYKKLAVFYSNIEFFLLEFFDVKVLSFRVIAVSYIGIGSIFFLKLGFLDYFCFSTCGETDIFREFFRRGFFHWQWSIRVRN